MTTQAILLPGAVMPAELAYGALLEALGDDVHPVAKDLEMYANSTPLLATRSSTRSTASFAPRSPSAEEERHHFDAPHRVEPERTARLLREHWQRTTPNS